MASEQGNLLHRLGIKRHDPWVWISSDGAIRDGDAVLQLQVDGPEGTPSTCPFPYPPSKQWSGYSVILVGRLADPWVLDNAVGTTGLPWQWEDDAKRFTVELYYQCVRYRDSMLYAELYTNPPRGRPPGHDIVVRGPRVRFSTIDREKAWQGMDLIVQGPQRGAPRGKRGPRDRERRKWWLRAKEIGWNDARIEFYAQGGSWDEWEPIQRHRQGTNN